MMSTAKKFLATVNLHKLTPILFVLLNWSCATQNPVSAQQEYVNDQVFYDQLSPYGEWIENPDYGYVWIPQVNQNFSPYSTSGYWVMTNYGWTWVSDYPWGWAPFHYGRWDFDNYYGWFWVPDYEWGPSWVTWRSGNGYYGWTPMRPGMNINMSFGNDYQDLDHWYFVRERDFGRHDMHRYYANRRDYNTIIINSTVIQNTYVDRSRNSTYISGPSRNDVQRVTGRKIGNVSVRDQDRPGQVMKNNQLQIYRPEIRSTQDRNQKPVPSRITNVKDIKPPRERIGTEQSTKPYPTGNSRNATEKSNVQQQTEKRDQQPRRQEQLQIERQNQQKQKQQINNRIQENVQQQNQNQNKQQQNIRRQRVQEQVEKQQKTDQQNQVKQQQNRRTQEQEVKQQREPQLQIQQQNQHQPQPNQTTEPSSNKRRNRP